MKQPRSIQVGLTFWSRWVLANTLIVAIVMAFTVGFNVILHAAIGWGVTGIAISVMQQYILQRYLPLNNWAWFSSLGWIAGVLLGKSAVGWQAAGWDIDWALTGLLVGIVQYFSMRKHISQAYWWILASSAALVLAGVLGGLTVMTEDWLIFKGLIEVDKDFTEKVGFVVSGAVGGATYGAVTGGWLIWLINTRYRPIEGET